MSQSDSKSIRFAKQTAGLEHAPSSLTFLCTEGLPQETAEQTKIERDLKCGDMETTARIVGPKNVGLAFDTEMRGCGTQGASGVAAVAPATLGALLDSIFGVAGSAATGDTISSAAVNELTVTNSNLADEDFVLLAGADSGNFQVRQITSGGGTTTPDIHTALTKDDNITEDPATGVVYGGVHWDLTNTNFDRDTLYFDLEGETTRHLYYGMIPNQLAINIPSDGGKVTCSWTLDGNNWEQAGSLANPVYSAPSDGDPLVAVDSPVWIDGYMFMARDISINISLRLPRKSTQFGINGYHGHGSVGADVTVSGGLYLGADNLEAGSTWRSVANTAATKDILIQVGRDPGNCFAVRIPAADLLVNETSFDGMDGLQFEAKATRTAVDGTSCARLAIF